MLLLKAVLFYKSLMTRNRFTSLSKSVAPFEHFVNGAMFNTAVGLRLLLMTHCIRLDHIYLDFTEDE